VAEALDHASTPWRARLAVNAATGQPYHGINVLLLLPLSMLFGDPRWCSYRQAEAHGWQVRQRERGTPICFYFYFVRFICLIYNIIRII